MGLGLPAATYQRLCAATYKRIKDQGPYVPPEDVENELVQQRAEKLHKELQEEYLFVNLLESTCLNMIKKALAPTILLPKTDRFTGIINGTIPVIFQYLFESYGNITSFSLENNRQALLATTYNHADPLDVVFHAIDDYADMADAHGTAVSEDQLIHFASMILMKASIFADSFEKWNDEQFKSWTLFQTFFTKAQATYKRARPTETSAALGYSSPPPQANAAMTDPSSALAEAEANIAQLEEAQTLAQANRVAPAPAPAPAPTPAPPAASTSPNDLLMEKLIAQMADLQAKVTNKTPKNNKDKKTPKERLYCWTHGSCAHNGKDCKNPKEGHKKEATFSNMMSGSTKECYWIKND